MKNFKSTLSFLLMVLMVSVTVSCDSLLTKDDDTYSGSAVVGFKIPNPEPVSEGSGDQTFEIQLIRSQEGVLDEALPVSFTVVDTMTTALDADYDIVTPSPVTIPAGSLVTDMQITLNGTGIAAGSARTLTIYLTGNAERGIEGDGNIGFLELTIVGQ